jgi:phenylacetate-CoA ligase
MNLLSCAMHLARLKVEQWQEPRLIRESQEKRLKALLGHCAANVPRYRDYDARSIEDLAELDIVTKEDVRDSPQEFMARNVSGPLEKLHTSGSTGMPLTICHTAEEAAYCYSAESFQLMEAGFTPLDRMARICDFTAKPNVLQRMGLFRTYNIHVKDSIERIYQKLEELRPSVLHCSPSIMAQLARCNKGLGLRLAFSGMEVLTPGTRRLIRSSFGCQIRDIYGSVETSWIAWECERGSMHVHPSTIVEVVDRHGRAVEDGEEGMLVMTPLWKKAMPLLRYRLGDRGSLGKRCPCGRGTQVLSSILGRDDDCVLLPSGRSVSARSFNFFEDAPVREYQVMQESRKRIVFRYVPLAGPLGPEWEEEVKNRLMKGCLGEITDIGFEEAQTLRQRPGAKLRTVVSKARP